jgi:hypothetical protein
MATVLEVYTTDKQRSFVLFCGQKNCVQRIVINKCSLCYGGKCLSRIAIQNWVEKFSQGRSKVADDSRTGAEVAETTVKRFVCCSFRRTSKAIGQVYQCWWRICREIKVVFPGLNITCFTSYIHL